MAHANIAHRRTHNLLLISKLLNQRDHASPFTLVYDTLEQTAAPLIREYIRRANLAKTHVIFLGFDTVRKPKDVESFVPCYSYSPAQISSAIAELRKESPSKRHLIIVDSLHTLCSTSIDETSELDLVAYFSSLLTPDPAIPTTQTSIVAIYHVDIPLPRPNAYRTYQPSPLSLLSYLATTLLTVHSLPILLAARLAQARSQIAPSYGLQEEKEGILVGLKPTKFRASALKAEEKGIVLELEHRRKSGRGVHEWYVLPSKTSASVISAQTFRETVLLLDDHPSFRKTTDDSQSSDSDLTGLTFELGLTERQKLERDGVVLPYFDAQNGEGSGEGGRILYDMGSEDDFDEEEDEI